MFNYSPPENSSISPGCVCSLPNVRRTQTETSKHIATLPQIEYSGIIDDTVKIFGTQNKSFDEQPLHMLSINPLLKSKQNTFKGTEKDLVTADPFAEQDKYDENISKYSNQYKRSQPFFPRRMDETIEPPLHLYLDIGITSENDNSPQLEELKKMFENFQTAEKNLSECINLHIYIFSKYIDTVNKTNTIWGRRVQHDNLSNFQQLTEIESKCNQPASIIKQSIYQIKHFLTRKDKTTEITLDEQDTVYSNDSYQETKAQNSTNEFGNVNASDVYPAALSTRLTVGNNKIDVTGNATIQTKKSEDVKYHTKDSTVYDEINPAVATDPTDYGDQGSTNKMIRTEISEKDMVLPRIITKELSNGTLLSVVDGFEDVPNSDFILANEDHNIVTTPSKDAAIPNTDLLKTNIDKIVPSHVVNIHGNLYFSFGEKQIPARFIQQSDGELDVAIDGFSMCNQMLEHNLSNFMNSLCKCIIRKNCT